MSSEEDNSFVFVSSYSVHPIYGNVEYAIHLEKRGEVARRRFREFLKLRDDLVPYWPDIPKLPSKFFNTSPVARLPHLNQFLVEVCETLGSRPPSPLLHFLCGDEQTFADARTLLPQEAAASGRVDIGTPRCPEPFQGDIERVIKQVLEIKNVKDGVRGWKLIGHRAPFSWMARAEDPTLGYTPCRVAYGELKRCPARTIHDMILDNDACKQMEPKLDSIQDVAKLDEQTIVQFFVMKSILFMPPRDVIMVRHWRVLPDGTIVHAEFSVEEYPGVPASGAEGRVRAKLTVGGLVIEPVEGDPTSCRIWRVSDMDPRLGDAIPPYVLAKLNEFTASMLSNNMFSLEKLVQKCNLKRELAKGPLVNWNGNVEGLLLPLVTRLPASKVGSLQAFDGELQKSAAEQLQDLAPYLIGFVLGFSAALVTFVTSNSS